MKFFPGLCLLLMFVAVPVDALEKEVVERAIQTPVRSLAPSPVEGLYEVVTQDNRIVYMDESGRFLVVGSILDIENRANLTELRMEEVSVVDFESLPLSEAIREGEGMVRIAVFDDPDCPFCRRMHKELKNLSDVTLYYFLFNLPSHPEAYAKSKKIVCAENPLGALDRAMDGDPLDDLAVCKTEQIERNKSLSLRIGVQATPYLVFENGRSVRGFRKSSEIQKTVNEILGLPVGALGTTDDSSNPGDEPEIPGSETGAEKSETEEQ